MICPFCQNPNDDNVVVCAHCGAPLQQLPTVNPSHETCATFGVLAKGFGICALIFACLSFLLSGVSALAILFAVLGIVFSKLANQKSAQLGLANDDAKTGMKFSIIGACVIGGNILLNTLILFGVMFFYILFIFSMVPVL